MSVTLGAVSALRAGQIFSRRLLSEMFDGETGNEKGKFGENKNEYLYSLVGLIQ